MNISFVLFLSDCKLANLLEQTKARGEKWAILHSISRVSSARHYKMLLRQTQTYTQDETFRLFTSLCYYFFGTYSRQL